MRFNGIRRRELLATAGLATAGIAGCSSTQEGDETDTEDDESDTTETETDPVNVDGLRLSLTPDTIEATDGSVEAWADDSGNGNDFTQQTAEARPSLESSAANGNAALQFNGETDYLLREDTLGIPNDSARTVVVVSRLSDPSARSPFLMQGLFGSSDSGSSYYGLEANTYNTTGERFGIYLVSVGYDAELEATETYKLHILSTESFPELSSIKNSTTYHVNGQQVGFQATPGNAQNSAFEADSTAIGAFPESEPGTLMHGEIAEVAVYGRVLEDAERSAIENELMAKYGIAAEN